jgi:uncharacterized linocin/CFP29 family protein
LAGREEDIMADSQLGWSDAQWEKVNNAVAESFAKASVAGAFLPCYGPLAGSAENVREVKLSVAGDGKVTIVDEVTKTLFNLTVKVELSTEQVADDTLTSALLAFRRAANTLALAEDDIVFNGYHPTAHQAARQAAAAAGGPPLKSIYSVIANNPNPSEGLAATRNENDSVVIRQDSGSYSEADADMERALVREIAGRIEELEGTSHPGPFACVLGHDLFVIAHNPTNSMVMAADRITPLLGGPLLRSSKLERTHAIVVSLAGDAIDIVVATPPTVQFLQRTPDAKYLFRVYERFRLRIKEDKDPAVRAFQLKKKP